MATQVFVNLTTTDLDRSKSFYTSLGATINPHFTDENAACIVFSDDVYFMILTHGHMSSFTDKPLSNPHESLQALVALTRDSREHVDTTVAAGLAAGGKEPRDAQDYGFMYSRTIEDPDGNTLEFLYMEPQAAEEGPEAYLAES